MMTVRVNDEMGGIRWKRNGSTEGGWVWNKWVWLRSEGKEVEEGKIERECRSRWGRG